MSKLPAYIGIDPGLSGALALYAQGFGPAIDARDMPVHENAGKRTINLWAVADYLDNWKEQFDIKQVVIERVHAMPAQGVVSSFSFGFSAGSAQQAVASAGLPMTLVAPATWKAVYGLRGGRGNKDASRIKASQLFPAYSAQWARKKDDGRAEAVLLAHYGSKLQ